VILRPPTEQILLPKATVVLWEPQPGPQTLLIQCPCFEVFFGGARGGGKTDGSLGDWLIHSRTYGQHASALFIRRKLTQLTDAIKRSKQLFSKVGATYNVQTKLWTFPNGSTFQFVYLERDSDAENYQGHEYTRVYIEEVTNFPDPEPIQKMKAVLRSSHGVPCGMRLTGNPGGAGHQWVKARYIDNGPFNVVRVTETVEFGDGTKKDISIERVFIPARLRDNPKLFENDPTYVARLRQVGSEKLVKAWLDGDWDGIDGSFFDMWDEDTHVIKEELPIPSHLSVFRAMDWGSARPFSVGWYAVSDGKSLPFPRGALYRFQEWYGIKERWAEGRIQYEPNQGIKLPANLVGRGVKARDPRPRVPGFADPSIFANNGGPSIAEMMLAENCAWMRADNARDGGWQQMRRRLDTSSDAPLLYFHESCTHAIRTIPFLQHDDKKIEDVDTDAEDHAGDEVRYACMTRPIIGDVIPNEPDMIYPDTPGSMTINQLIARQRARNQSSKGY